MESNLYNGAATCPSCGNATKPVALPGGQLQCSDCGAVLREGNAPAVAEAKETGDAADAEITILDDNSGQQPPQGASKGEEAVDRMSVQRSLRAGAGDSPAGQLFNRMVNEIGKIYVGQDELVLGSLVALFSSGHTRSQFQLS